MSIFQGSSEIVLLENTIKITDEHITEELTLNISAKKSRKRVKVELPTCPICIENYNKSSRALVKCEYCPFEACSECCRHYLLQENDPVCMSGDCNRQWTPEFLSNHFSKKFVNTEYKNHCEKVLFDKQRALLPSTQQLVENILKREDYQLKIRAADEVVNAARIAMHRIQNEYYRFTNTGVAGQERAVFTRACPNSECRGFLSSQWKCGLCNKWCCNLCHEVKGMERDCEHTCDPNNVATATLLNSDTKPCPKCGEGIFKIDGCFAVDTPIFLHNVSTKMSQDIVVGDVLVGDDMEPQTVSRLMQGEDELFEVQQDNGITYTVNSRHTLVLKQVKTRFLTTNETVEIIVDDYMKLSDQEKRQLFGYKVKHQIRYLFGYKITTKHDIITAISVKSVGRGKYFGWTIDSENHRFLLKDHTCVKNCDQIWCTQCQTAFSWRTGKVETGAVHNPHYYEWMRRNGTLERNPADVQCGREINHQISGIIRNHLNSHESRNPENSANIKNLLKIASEIVRKIIHLRYNTITRYQYNTDEVTQQLRIKYMRRFIDDDFFKISLQKEYKRSNKYREICEVIQLLINTLTDIIHRFVDEIKERNWKFNLDRMNEVEHIIKYSDECFLKISRTYSSTPLVYNRL
jgi:hypothetical protein